MDRSSEEFDDCFELIQQDQVLGKGSFAFVFEAKSRKQQDEQVAVKIYLLERGHEELITNEVNSLKELQHPNIIKLESFFKTPDYAYLVFERIYGGELIHRITHGRGLPYNEHQIRLKCKALLSAIAHCHEHGVIHRDIKPENILLTSYATDADIKLVDFGLSVKTEGNLVCSGRVGTYQYMAPEIWKSEPYSRSVDLWSFGVTVFLLLSGKLPFHVTRDHTELGEKIVSINYAFDGDCRASDEAKDFVQKLLVESSKRISAAEAMQHPWMISNTSDADSATLNLQSLKEFDAARRIMKTINVLLALRRWRKRAAKSAKERAINRSVEFSLPESSGSPSLARTLKVPATLSSRGSDTITSADAFSSLAASASGIDALLSVLEQDIESEGGVFNSLPANSRGRNTGSKKQLTRSQSDPGRSKSSASLHCNNVDADPETNAPTKRQKIV